MSVTQTVEIPDSRRLTIDVPSEVPTGPVILTFTPVKAKVFPDTLTGGCYNTVEEALQAAAEKAANPNSKPISSYFGILSPDTYGNGVVYQRNLRDEWDD